MFILILLLISLVFATTGLFYFNMNFSESDTKVINDYDIGKTIELKEFNGKTLKLGDIQKKGVIRVVSNTEDLIRFDFNAKYNIQETGNSCSETIQCKPGLIEEERIKETSRGVKNVSLMLSNFEIEIDTRAVVPEVNIKSHNVDNLKIL